MPPNVHHKSIRTPLPDESAPDYHPQCPLPDCPYEKEKENWFDSKLLKVAGVIIGLLSPLFVWIVISIFDIKTEQAVQKQKIEAIIDIKSDLMDIKRDIVTIKVDLAQLKSRGP